MPALATPAATFVTLRQAGELRGCIGSLEPPAPARRRRAGECGRRRVPRPALSAARPIASSRRTSIEVSLLSRDRARGCPATRSDLLAQLRPGVDGVIVSHSAASARRSCRKSGKRSPTRASSCGVEAARRGSPADFWSPRHERFALHGDQVDGARIPVERRAAMTRESAVYPGRWWHRAARRPDPVRPLPARLPAARGPARRVLRAPARRRCDGAHDVRPLVRLLHRPDREEAAQPFLPGIVGVLVRHGRLQPRVQVLPELGHLEVARDGHADGCGVARSDRRDGGEAAAAAAWRSPTTIPSSSPSTRWIRPTPATR